MKRGICMRQREEGFGDALSPTEDCILHENFGNDIFSSSRAQVRVKKTVFQVFPLVAKTVHVPSRIRCWCALDNNCCFYFNFIFIFESFFFFSSDILCLEEVGK